MGVIQLGIIRKSEWESYMGNIEISEEYWNSNLRESSSWRELGEKIESVLGATIVLLFLISPNIHIYYVITR